MSSGIGDDMRQIDMDWFTQAMEDVRDVKGLSNNDVVFIYDTLREVLTSEADNEDVLELVEQCIEIIEGVMESWGSSNECLEDIDL